jgi:hypothetical protein
MRTFHIKIGDTLAKSLFDVKLIKNNENLQITKFTGEFRNYLIKRCYMESLRLHHAKIIFIHGPAFPVRGLTVPEYEYGRHTRDIEPCCQSGVLLGVYLAVNPGPVS